MSELLTVVAVAIKMGATKQDFDDSEWSVWTFTDFQLLLSVCLLIQVETY